MGGLVDDLLLLARLDQGRPLEHEPVDLAGSAPTRWPTPGPSTRTARSTRRAGPVVVLRRPRPAAARWPTTWCATPSTTPRPARRSRVEVPRRGAIGRARRCPTQGPGLEPARRPPGCSTGSTGATPARTGGAAGSASRSSGPSPRSSAARRRRRSVPGQGRPSTWRSRCVPTDGRRAPALPDDGRAGRAATAARPLSRAELPGRGPRAPGTSFTSVSASSAVGSEPATMPAPAHSGRGRRDGGRAEADHPVPVAVAVDPADRARPTGPRGPVSSSAMSARATARGTPPTAGVGWRAASSSRTLGTGRPVVEQRPSMRVPRWATVRSRRAAGSSGTHELGAARVEDGRRSSSTTSSCSSRSLADASSRSVARSSSRASAPEPDGAGQRVAGDGPAPAGDEQLRGGAEEPPPGSRGCEKAVQDGSWSSRRPSMASGRERCGKRGVEAPGQHHLAQPRRRRWPRSPRATASA